jgi:serine protease
VAAQLRQSGQVVYAQPLNRIYTMLEEPNDGDWNYYESGEPMVPLGEYSFRRLWYLDDTLAFEGWSDWPNTWYTAATRPQNSPIIAVIDTGADLTHPDYINSGGTGTDVTQGGQFLNNLGRRFEFGDIVPGAPVDVQGHGTHVTGLALAAGNNGSFGGQGMIGIGYPCRGMILRVFDDNGVGSDADAAAAIYYATDNGADIINLSLGTTNYSQLFQDAVTYANQKGVLVLAAGNESGSGGGPLGPIYPAANTGVVSVTANGPGFLHASDYYAGSGSYLDMAAPGGNLILDYSNIEDPIALLAYIWSTTMTTTNPILENPLVTGYYLNYGYLIGTSMATPMVAGAMGLYYGKFGLDRNDGDARIRAIRALQRSVYGAAGAPKGSWEPSQGFGCLDVFSLLNELDSRDATAGGIEGMVYLNGTATSNVTVRAKRDGSATTFSTTTGADGTYRFDQLPEGKFQVWAAPGGQRKDRRAVVIPGSDAQAIDFWCGTYTGDETAPIVETFEVAAYGTDYIDLRVRAYDTETGIEQIHTQVGTSPGATDVVPPTLMTWESGLMRIPVPAPGLVSGSFYITGKFTNGNGTVTNANAVIHLNTPDFESVFVSQTVPNTVPAGQTFSATLTFKNVGSQTWQSYARQKLVLMAMNPQGNTRWGTAMAVVPPNRRTRPGENLSLQVQFRAPMTLGSHAFQWSLARTGTGGVYPFGAHSSLRSITVN